MPLSDEEYTEQISELVGDVAVEIHKLIQARLSDDSIKNTWKSLTQRFITLLNED